MQWSVVNMSRVKRSHPEFRLEAEFFSPLFLSLEDRLHNQPMIGDIKDELVCGPFGSAILDETYVEEGIKVIRPFNIKSCKIEDENLVYIDEADVKSKGLKLFSAGTIFFARVGDVKCGIFDKDEEVTISPNIIALKVNDKKVNPYFLTVFLNSFHGLKQLERQLKTTSQPTISTEFLNFLKVPNLAEPFTEKIASFLKTSINATIKSEQIYNSAETLLLTELGLENWQPKKQLSFVANYAEVAEANRFDADYFQPHYKEMLERLEFSNSMRLSEIVDYEKGVEVGTEAYQADGIPFIRVSDVSEHGFEKTEKYISPELYQQLRGNHTPKKGDVLFTKDGIIGRSFVVQEDEKAILSGAFLRLAIKPNIIIQPDYLALILNSIICKTQIERLSGGAIIAHLKPSDAMAMTIPVLDDGVQTEICSLIAQSRQEREKSKRLLETAKRAVEIAIEKDEAAAFDYIEKETI